MGDSWSSSLLSPRNSCTTIEMLFSSRSFVRLAKACGTVTSGNDFDKANLYHVACHYVSRAGAYYITSRCVSHDYHVVRPITSYALHCVAFHNIYSLVITLHVISHQTNHTTLWIISRHVSAITLARLSYRSHLARVITSCHTSMSSPEPAFPLVSTKKTDSSQAPVSVSELIFSKLTAWQ